MLLFSGRERGTFSPTTRVQEKLLHHTRKLKEKKRNTRPTKIHTPVPPTISTELAPVRLTIAHSVGTNKADLVKHNREITSFVCFAFKTNPIHSLG